MCKKYFLSILAVPILASILYPPLKKEKKILDRLFTVVYYEKNFSLYTLNYNLWKNIFYYYE